MRGNNRPNETVRITSNILYSQLGYLVPCGLLVALEAVSLLLRIKSSMDKFCDLGLEECPSALSIPIASAGTFSSADRRYIVDTLQSVEDL
jgi:hypothetical protein